MITTVIFDLDDTLYDEIDYCKSGFFAVSEFLAGLPGAPSADRIFAAFWDQFAAGNRPKVFNSALDTLKMDYNEERIQELVGIYRNHIPKITLPANSRDVLTELEVKYTLALHTDGFLPAQQLKVQTLGVEKFFRIIIYTERLGRECWKPSPAGFEKIIKDLSEVPARMVYVGDNEKKDFIAPNRLGFSTVQLIRPARVHTSVSTESGAAAQHVIHQISELPALLHTL
ncbi:MAG: HAD family hydrolase [Sedimentisphaerales bacterium]|nr:HAD family hydrolase [Sedimentisphaerales bacterium]